jgi:hypothetical protein
MRIFAVILFLLASFPAVAIMPEGPDAISFRLYLGDIYRMRAKIYPQDPEMTPWCEMAQYAAEQEHPGNEAWLGMVSQCFGEAQMQDEGGYRLAACEYFIEAERHYQKAHTLPEEAAALLLMLDAVKQHIAKLEC